MVVLKVSWCCIQNNERQAMEKEGVALLKQAEYGYFGAPDYERVLAMMRGEAYRGPQDARWATNPTVMARAGAALQVVPNPASRDL
jgi:hypothetical protein